MIEKIIAKVKRIDNDALLSVNQIGKMNVVLNTKLKPSVYSFYRILRRKEIKSINLGTEKSPKYFVKGSDLKKYLLKRYSTIDN